MFVELVNPMVLTKTQEQCKVSESAKDGGELEAKKLKDDIADVYRKLRSPNLKRSERRDLEDKLSGLYDRLLKCSANTQEAAAKVIALSKSAAFTARTLTS